MGALRARNLGQVVEVPVSRAQDEVVLEGERRDPEVMHGNRLPPTAKVAKERGVVVGRLLVREECGHARLGQKRAEDALVLAPAASESEAGPKLRYDHEGEEHRFGVLDQPHDPCLASAQVRVGVGVEGEPQRQRCLSMRRWAARARSNSGSSTQVPAMSRRSRCAPA